MHLIVTMQRSHTVGFGNCPHFAVNNYHSAVSFGLHQQDSAQAPRCSILGFCLVYITFSQITSSYLSMYERVLTAGVSVLLPRGACSKSTQILVGSLAYLKDTRFKKNVCLKKYKPERKPVWRRKTLHTGQDFQ